MTCVMEVVYKRLHVFVFTRMYLFFKHYKYYVSSTTACFLFFGFVLLLEFILFCHVLFVVVSVLFFVFSFL